MIVSFVGVVASTIILIWGLVGEYKDPDSSIMVTIGAWVLRKYPLLVIAGVAGELFFNTVSFVSSITLDVWHSAELTEARTIASEAYKVGTANQERAEKLEQDNLVLKTELTKTQKELTDSKLALQKQLDSQRGIISNVAASAADRDIGSSQRRSFENNIHGHARAIVVVLLNEREPRAYGTVIANMLTNAHFAVRKIDFIYTSPSTGVIVCENGAADTKLFRALKRAEIATELRHVTTKYVQDHPAECQDDSPDETKIFIGQRPAREN
jgi:hypothetical protein